MGLAAEHLGEHDREMIAEEILTGVDDRKSGLGKIWAHCPFHIENTPGGAFFYDARDDQGKCFSCGTSEDLVAIYNIVTRRDPQDKDGVKEFITKYCPEAVGTQGRRQSQRRSRPKERRWTGRDGGDASKSWSRHALKFLEGCEKALQQNRAAQEQLAAWGLPLEACRLCRIGWNPEITFRPVTGWGLPFESANNKSGERHIVLDKGLVFAMFEEKRLVRLKIRLADPRPAEGDFQGDPRWRKVLGGSDCYFVYGRKPRVWVVVETERDAAALWWALRGLGGVGAMATGSASARPDKRAAEMLRRADLVLNALDTDKAGAENTYRFWENWFPHAVRWPVPKRYGKDVGDAIKAGMNIRAWVWAGMPNHARRLFMGRPMVMYDFRLPTESEWRESKDIQAIGDADQFVAWIGLVGALQSRPGLGLARNAAGVVEVVGDDGGYGAVKYARERLPEAGPFVAWGMTG